MVDYCITHYMDVFVHICSQLFVYSRMFLFHKSENRMPLAIFSSFLAFSDTHLVLHIPLDPFLLMANSPMFNGKGELPFGK